MTRLRKGGALEKVAGGTGCWSGGRQDNGQRYCPSEWHLLRSPTSGHGTAGGPGTVVLHWVPFCCSDLSLEHLGQGKVGFGEGVSSATLWWLSGFS